MKGFHFFSIDMSTVMEDINNLKPKKTLQDTNVLVKIFKLNYEFFAEYIYYQFNIAIPSSTFLASFKSDDVTPLFKNGSRS